METIKRCLRYLGIGIGAVGSIAAASAFMAYRRRLSPPSADGVGRQPGIDPVNGAVNSALRDAMTEAQAALNEAKKDSLISMAALAKSEKESQELKLELTRVQSDLELAKQLSPISELSYNNLKSDYDNLLVKYNEKAKESGEYFMEAVEHRQDNWGGLVGGGVVWDPTDGSLAATMDMGVRYKQWALVVGAEYRPSDWKLEVPDISDLSFSTGLQFSF